MVTTADSRKAPKEQGPEKVRMVWKTRLKPGCAQTRSPLRGCGLRRSRPTEPVATCHAISNIFEL